MLDKALHKRIKIVASQKTCNDFVLWFAEHLLLQNRQTGKDFLAYMQVKDAQDLYIKLRM